MAGILAKRHLLTFGLIVSGVLAFAACGGGAGGNAPLTATDIISKAQSAHLKDATYTLNYTINGTANGTAVNSQFTGSGEITNTPPRNHLSITGSFSGITVTVEEITDGTTSYSKTTSASLPSDGKWTKSTANSTDPSSLNFGSLYDGIKNPKLVGTEKVNGNDTYHITGTPVVATDTSATPSANSATTATEDVWIRTDNFYPAKLSETGTSATGSGLVDTGTSNIVVTFTKWDSGVTITVPSPDQVSAGS